MTASAISDVERGARPTRDEIAHARNESARRRWVAFGLVTPLLAFVAFAFIAPIGSMLYRSVYNDTVVKLIPATLEALTTWDGEGMPDDAVLTSMAIDIKRLANERTSGKLAEELNRALPAAASTVKSTARALRRADDADLAANGAALLIEANDSWADPAIWTAVRTTGRAFHDVYFLTSLDLERRDDGSIRPREDVRVYIPLFLKTLRMALVISVFTFLLGYPLAYYMANVSPGQANILMVLVLLPFWTSFLVRTTAWIALLQTNGVVNTVLMALGIIGDPLEMMYTEFATIVSMVHILLPFMVLPLYAVMRGIDPSFMRAAVSLGAPRLKAFFDVYFPMTLPGLSAGCLLVFVIAVGYYITPALMGGTDGQMISNIIASHMKQANNWELAAALGTLLLAIVIALYWVYDLMVGADKIRLS